VCACCRPNKYDIACVQRRCQRFDEAKNGPAPHGKGKGKGADKDAPSKAEALADKQARENLKQGTYETRAETVCYTFIALSLFWRSVFR
jgi:hypothetical protein